MSGLKLIESQLLWKKFFYKKIVWEKFNNIAGLHDIGRAATLIKIDRSDSGFGNLGSRFHGSLETAFNGLLKTLGGVNQQTCRK